MSRLGQMIWLGDMIWLGESIWLDHLNCVVGSNDPVGSSEPVGLNDLVKLFNIYVCFTYLPVSVFQGLKSVLQVNAESFFGTFILQVVQYKFLFIYFFIGELSSVIFIQDFPKKT